MIKMIDGKWHMQITRPGGATEFIPLYGEEKKAMDSQYLDRQAEFAAANYWDPSKDYTSTFDNIFGGIDSGSNYTPSFGAGPNQRWEAALKERLRLRAKGLFNSSSQYETGIKTTSHDYQEKMYARNNAIEEMYRQGYDFQQIADHVEGRVNINTVDPSYKDYLSTRGEFGDSAGDYFKVPDNVEEILGDRRREGIQSTYQTMVNNIKSLFNDPQFRQSLGNYSPVEEGSEPEVERERNPMNSLSLTRGLFGDKI